MPKKHKKEKARGCPSSFLLLCSTVFLSFIRYHDDAFAFIHDRKNCSHRFYLELCHFQILGGCPPVFGFYFASVTIRCLTHLVNRLTHQVNLRNLLLELAFLLELFAQIYQCLRHLVIRLMFFP